MASFYEDPNRINNEVDEGTPFEGTKNFFGLYSILSMVSFVLLLLSIIGDGIATLIVGFVVSPTYFLLFLAEIPLIICAVIDWKFYKYASWAKDEHEDLEERLDLIEERLKHIK